MLKRELKVNLKSFIMWTLIISSIIIVAYLFYPALDETASFDELLESLPKELLMALNMDIVNINTPYGWFATEGYLMLALLGGCYSSLLGGSIVIKEESEKTIEFLMSKPISRVKIIKDKLIAGLIYIFSLNLILFFVSFIGLTLLDDLNFKMLLLLSGSVLFIHFIFYFLSLFISLFFKKSKKMVGISLGLVLGTYFLQVLAMLDEKIEFLKYFSPHEYFSARYIIINESYNLNYLILTFIIIFTTTVLSIKIYKNKEFTL